MITHFLGKEEVDGYARDFAARLTALGDKLPKVWCPIGYSGDRISRIVAQFVDQTIIPDIQVIQISHNKSTGTIQFGDPSGDAAAIRAAGSVLVIDSSIHSGSTMLDVTKKIEALGAKNVLTYSLILKQNSKFVPHFFGVIVGDHDRTLFLLDRIPNNRLFKPNNFPIGNLRRLSAEDCKKDMALNTGLASIDKTTISDLWYQKVAHGHEIFVMEVAGKIGAFLGLRFSSKAMLIDVVASDKSHVGKGLGGALLRWAETLARSRKCSMVELWGIDNKVQMYEHIGFIKTGEILDLGSEKYFRMTRGLLYNFDLRDLSHA